MGWHRGHLSRGVPRRPHPSQYHGEWLVVSEFTFFFFIVVFGTTGEMFMSRAMKETGEVKDFRPVALIESIFRALRVRWMWFGVGMMAIGFFSLLAVLSFENVSFVVPVTALSRSEEHTSELQSRQ